MKILKIIAIFLATVSVSFAGIETDEIKLGTSDAITSWATSHEDLSGLQGGATDEHYHFSLSRYSFLTNIVDTLWPVTTNNYETRLRALEVSYQPFSSTNTPDAGGTCTIVYASGSLVKIDANTNITLTFDNTAFPTEGVSRVGVEIYSPTNSVAFATATITNATAPTISTSSWTSLFFRRVTTNLWYGRQ